jgi:purine-nucleoside phosphorylase
VSASSYYDQVQSAAARVRSTSARIPAVAWCSGRGSAISPRASSARRRYPTRRFRTGPRPTWSGHEGVSSWAKCRAGWLRAIRPGALLRRHDLRTVTFATRVLRRARRQGAILTNAAGRINTAFTPATDGHRGSHQPVGSNPLVGQNDERFGVRFPDLTNVYSRRLRAIGRRGGGAQRPGAASWNLCCVPRAFVRNSCRSEILRLIGGTRWDVHGPGGIVARHMGLEVLAISCITNSPRACCRSRSTTRST